MAVLLNYTREPMEDAVYANRLAYSMHLALQTENGWLPLNHNSGVLFVKATENEDGSLNAKSLRKPFLFQAKDESYGVVAIRTEVEGEVDTQDIGSVILWKSKDLLHYEELGVLHLCDGTVAEVQCHYDKQKGYEIFVCDEKGNTYIAECEDIFAAVENAINISVKYSVQTKVQTEVQMDEECIKTSFDTVKMQVDIEGVVPHNTIEISEDLADYLKKKLLTPEQVGISVEDNYEVSSKEDVMEIKAFSAYSDGSKIKKRVNWNLDQVDFDKKGIVEIEGSVIQEHFPFPMITNRADPCICMWQGKYYFVSTNDADHEHTMYARVADTMEGLITAEDHLILDAYTYPEIGGLLWAPEFHEINGRLYIFHAATPEPFFCEESHLMELREGGSPICKEDWSRPRRIVKMDGSDLCEAGKTISLDMTHFVWEGEHYVVWSQRQFLPKDLGAWLYIAKLNPKKPWQLASEPVVLSKPEYGWANNHTFVDEGPFALMNGGKLYLTFSAAAVDSTYVVGLFSIEPGKDLLKRENWVKNNYPILTSRCVEGEYGTGHNAYVTDEYGTVWNTYHARPGVDGPRSSGVRRVHFDVDGEPVLDVTEEKDLKPEFSKVKTTVTIK